MMEAAYLGSCLRGSRPALAAVGRLTEDDFTDAAVHRRVFRAVRSLLEQERSVELMSVLDELGRLGELRRWPAGSSRGPRLLDLHNAAPLPASGDYYAHLVLENAGRRLQQALDGGGSVVDLEQLIRGEGRAVLEALGRVNP